VCKQAVGQPRKVGRPLIVESPEEMDRLVDEYVANCHENDMPLTLTGLVLALGLSSRQSLNHYGDRQEFCASVKRSKLLVERAYEERLHGPNPTGAIFALKNFGWTDRQEVESTGWLASIDVTRLSDDQIQRIRNGENVMAVLGTSPPIRALPAGNHGAGSG